MKIFYLIVTIITLIACEAESQIVDFPLRITDGVIADTLRYSDGIFRIEYIYEVV